MSLKKLALFTDIHFGKKNNSLIHNQDCLDFIDWFCDIVRKKKADGIVFMGDWFENRNAINVLTMFLANQAIRKLDALDLPIYVLVGNHDLYHRENRNIFSTSAFSQYANITVINEPTVIQDSILLCPYLFKWEYEKLAQFQKIPFWLGHFEFKNFVVTGSDRRMETGLDHSLFKEQKYILSGHFHKRQITDNVIYIGNTFPMDYGDVWDDERGCSILDLENDDIEFIDWKDAPKYRKMSLSDVLNLQDIQFPPKCRVKCIIDTDIGYSEAQQLKEEMVKQLQLREFVLEENAYEKQDALEGDDVIDEFDFTSLNDAVIKMIKTGITATSTIEPQMLIEVYNRL
jgi:DNA repair exonuclease SbcCD nuclease subunit